MIGEVNLPVSTEYMTIPARIREQLLDVSDPRDAQCLPIGDCLQVVVFGNSYDLVVRARFKEWYVGRPRQRKLNGECGVHILRWRDKLRIVSDDGRDYVPAQVSTTRLGAGLPRPPLDDDHISFDEADAIVEEYIESYQEQRTTTRSTDVASAMGVEANHHNLQRLHTALEQRLDIRRMAASKATQFKMPDSDT